MRKSHFLVSCLIGALCFAGAGIAQYAQEDIPLSEVLAKGGKKLSKDDIAQLLPGAKITSVAGSKSVRRWENKPDGKIFVSSTGSKLGAPGTWEIDDKGAFCVQIEWQKSPSEKWCRFVFQAGSDYYATASEKNMEGKAYKLGIEK